MDDLTEFIPAPVAARSPRTIARYRSARRQRLVVAVALYALTVAACAFCAGFIAGHAVGKPVYVPVVAPTHYLTVGV